MGRTGVQLKFISLCAWVLFTGCQTERIARTVELSSPVTNLLSKKPYLGFGERGKSGSFAHELTLFWRYEPVHGCSDCRRYRVIVDDQDPNSIYSPMAQFIEAEISDACGETKRFRSTPLQPMGREAWAPAVAELDVPMIQNSCSDQSKVTFRLLSPACLDANREDCRHDKEVMSASITWDQLMTVPVHLGAGMPNGTSQGSATADRLQVSPPPDKRP